MIKKTQIGLIIGILILVIIGIFFYGLVLMDDEDRHVDLTDKIELQDGDLIFQTSESSQSKAIQLATMSEYTLQLVLVYNKDVREMSFQCPLI